MNKSYIVQILHFYYQILFIDAHPSRMLLNNLGNGRKDVGVTGVQDRHNTDSEQLTTNSSQLVVTTLEVVDLGLGQHGVVFQLRLSQDWGVTGNDNQLGLTSSQGLDN